MGSEKRALMCVFKPDKLKSTKEMRELFSGSYPTFLDRDDVEFKCWWCDKENGQWGAFYIFTSEEVVEEYVKSDLWLKVVPEKYGCTPTWNIVEPGPILSKKEIKVAKNSWKSD